MDQWKRGGNAAGALGMGLALWGCLAAGCAPSETSAPTVELSPCRPEGIAEEIRCGVLERPEDPASPEGRKVRLAIAVMPARTPRPKSDPLYVAAGGPGQSARETAPMIARLLAEVRRERDVVLVDQRGTGSSEPNLRCDEGFQEGATAAERLRKMTQEADAAQTKKCLEALSQKADLRFYGTSLAVDDLEAVRQALGHGEINLWGVSYGTRVVLNFIRRYGGHVRSAVIDGVVPPGLKLSEGMGKDAAAALAKTFADCAADEKCAAAFPDAAQKFAGLLERLQKSPMKLSVPDPLSGQPAEAEISAGMFASVMRLLLYDPDLASLVPLTVDALDRGDGRSFLAQMDLVSQGSASAIAYGMHLSVFCGEDFSGSREKEALPSGEASIPGLAIDSGIFVREAMAGYARSCALWPSSAPTPEMDVPVKSDVPLLVLSGALDPVTPPANGERAAQGFSRVRHAVAPGAAHSLSNRGCSPRVIAQFLKKPDPGALDVRCIEAMARPPFFLSFAGPEP